MPNDFPLPDGRTLVLPDNLSMGDRAFLRSTLGPEGYAAMQAHLASRKPLEQAAQEQTERQTKLSERMNRASKSPTPFTAATSMYAPMAAVKSIVGAKIGSTAGRRLAGPYGELAGGAVGGAIGALPGPSNLTQRILRGPSGTSEVTINPATIATRELEAKVPMNEPPGAREEMQMDLGQQSADAIARENLAQRAAARQSAQAGKAVPVSRSPGPYRGPGPQGVGVPGSTAQEAGYKPPVTKVPIRPAPPSPLTAEQVPGPDTAGKGNLLTPAARRGDPRAAQELMRRGRQVLYTPAEEYPETRLQGTLAERLRGQAPGPQQPMTSLSERTSQSLRPEVQEMATSKSYGPEFEASQRQEMIDRYKGILRNRSATPEDLKEASARLNEMGALF